MKDEVFASALEHFEVICWKVKQTRENSSSYLQSEKFKVSVCGCVGTSFLNTGYYGLSPRQFSCFVQLLHNLICIFDKTFLLFLIFKHELQNFLFSCKRFGELVQIVFARVQPILDLFGVFSQESFLPYFTF